MDKKDAIERLKAVLKPWAGDPRFMVPEDACHPGTVHAIPTRIKIESGHSAGTCLVVLELVGETQVCVAMAEIIYWDWQADYSREPVVILEADSPFHESGKNGRLVIYQARTTILPRWCLGKAVCRILPGAVPRTAVDRFPWPRWERAVARLRKHIAPKAE
jgi:hypothetical protein